MRYILTILLLTFSLFANEIKSGYWERGETLLTFFEKNDIPQKLYYSLPKADRESAMGIYAGTRYFTMHDSEGKLTELLLPISDELQIKVYSKDGAYHFTTTPISFSIVRDTFVIELNNSPYYDIVKHTGLKSLADEFVAIFKHSIDFRRSIRKGDKLVISYEQKMRLGQPHGSPTINLAMIETNKTPHFLINYENRYFNEKGIEVEGFYLTRPVSAGNSWISSHYSKKRWHPILKRYRAHLGVDYAANTGTPIQAAAGGKVIAKGRRSGYGNTVTIDHGNGFKTLYAHMSNYRRGVNIGSYVKRGQTIGYVGSTGLSTGPHLHFELVRRGQ
ncbi:MAG: peptidoglycan DD-metalloendopeptidase family protein, partial [Campylobacterota bacterium]